jgi:hypothetical protein
MIARWFRIDRSGVTGVLFDVVQAAARTHFHNPLYVVDAGRFTTPAATYSREHYLTSQEQAARR